MDINIGINEKIVTGRKFRRLIDKDSKLWQLISWWTKARDVEFDDGKTAEQKLGNINGITSDLMEKHDFAASIASVYSVNEELQYRIGGFRIYRDEDGNIYIIDENAGADSVPKKLGDVDPETFSAGTDAEYLFAENTPYAYCLKCGLFSSEEDDHIHGVYQESTYGSRVYIKLPNADKYTTIQGNTDTWKDEASGMSLTKVSYKYTRAGVSGSGGYGVYLFILKDIPAGTMLKSNIVVFK